MADLSVVVSDTGRLQIRSRTLFADLNLPQTKAFLSCVVEADPLAQVAIHRGGMLGRDAYVEVRHSYATPDHFLKALTSRLRSGPKVATRPVNRQLVTDAAAKSIAVVTSHVMAAIRDGSTERRIPTIKAPTVRYNRLESKTGNNRVRKESSQPLTRNLPFGENPTENKSSQLRHGDTLIVSRQETTTIGAGDKKSSVSSWEIVHDLPGRLRLKHKSLYRRKEVCQLVERELMSVLGVDSYKTRSTTGTVLIHYDAGKLRKDQILRILDRAISSADLTTKLDMPDVDFPLAVASVPVAAAAQFAVPALLPVAGLMFVCTSVTTFKHAHKVLFKERRLGVDFLDAIVVAGCLGTAQIFAGSVLSLCLSFGRSLVKKTQDDSKRLIVQAFGKQAQFVRLYLDGQEIETPLENVKKGDIIVVHTGDAVPVDGIVKEGMAMLDQHALTGESTPTEKSPGDHVFASTLVVAGKMFVEVETAGSETASAKIAQILNDSTGHKLSSQHKGERMADKAVIPTLCISSAAYATMGPQGAVAVLNSDFGTGIRMAAPLGMLSSLALCAHKGILVKDGRALEMMNEIDTVLFDKTGTLTEETPTVGRVVTFNGHQSNRLLQLVAAAEQRFAHPIAKAIMSEFEKTGLQLLPIDESKYQVGYGIDAGIDGHKVMVGSIRYLKMEGIEIPEEVTSVVEMAHTEGHTLIMVALDRQFAGLIELRASQRPEVLSMIKGLRDRGIKHIAIISGDHEAPTRKLAKHLGMDEYFAGVLPGDKANYVERLQQQGRKVCFVGDGINDSIALKKADVSISLRGASSIATDTAQIVFMEESLHRLCELRDIARSLDRNVRNSWYLILAPNSLCILGAFTMGFGIMASVLINNVSSLAALANGMLPLKRITDTKSKKLEDHQVREVNPNAILVTRSKSENADFRTDVRTQPV